MRKISAHYIFPVSSKPLKKGILILDDNNVILDVLDTKGILKEQSGIEFYDGIITPGFVNAHCHLELSHLKNRLSSKGGLASFIREVQKLRLEDEEKIEAAMKQADEEMRSCGIVAVGDISNSKLSLNIKKNSRIYYHTFFEVFGIDEEKAGFVFDNVNALMEEARIMNLPASITPHAPYSLSEKLFSLLQDTLKETGLLSIHMLESSGEKAFFNLKDGMLFNMISSFGLKEINEKDPLDYITRFFPDSVSTLFVHNTFAQAGDIFKITKYFKNPYFVFCPKSNLFIENCLPDLSLWKDKIAMLALGTDSLSSNDTLSVLEEMKVLQSHFPFLTLEEIIQIATLGGARAMQIEQLFGSFEIGKKPGVNLIKNIDFDSFKLTASSTVTPLVN